MVGRTQERTVDLERLLARHGSSTAKSQLTPAALEDLLERGSTSVEATVVVGDLRLSGLVLKEAVQSAQYARFIIGFTEAVHALTNASDGWFDKFTGDGFISFWVTRAGEALGVLEVVEFCQSVRTAGGSLIERLRKNSRNFPIGVGLSLGADAGPCELVRVGESLTLIGTPIVGATRMVEGARANQTLVNVYLGAALKRERHKLSSARIRVEETSVKTKEYPEGQEAFALFFPATLRRAKKDPAAN